MRTVYLTVGAGAVSILFIACYGMPLNYDYNDYSTEMSSEELSETEDTVDEP